MELKKKDSLRKKLKAVENTMRRRQDPEDAERNRNKEREKSAWKERKQRRQFSQKLTIPVKRKVKNLEQKLRRKYMKLSEEKSSKKGHLHLKSHLKIANSLLAKQFGMCHQSRKRFHLKSQKALTV